MPNTITYIFGMPSDLSAFNISECLVVRLNRAAKDTHVVTLITNSTAPSNPCLVMEIEWPRKSHETNASPGVKTPNIAGNAMNSENIGINIHVLAMKDRKDIFDAKANMRQKIYMASRNLRSFMKSVPIMAARTRASFILGPSDCKSPG